MKANFLLCCLCLLLTSTMALADTVIVGTPANSLLAVPTGPSPVLNGVQITFDGLNPFATFSNYASNGVDISSPDGFIVLPFSTQSFPNELFDGNSDGTADITIDLTDGVTAIGVGIADSDPVSVTFQTLNASLMPFGSAFTEDLATTENAINTGNGYYVVKDTSPDIFGLRIIESVGNANFSGLAIDDVQVAPEPNTAVLALAGVVLMLATRKRLTQLIRRTRECGPDCGSGNSGLFPAA